MATAKKTDPDLWEEVKDELMQSDKGGEPGQWSARKAQMAVQEYKKRGGGYEEDGPDQQETDLNDWTEEEWGTKSGAQSGETGERYLPKRVRMLLTEDEYARSTAKKRGDTHGDGEQFSDQPQDVAAKVSRIKSDGPTKDDLIARARDLGIEGRSSMAKDELLDAIDGATDENGRGHGSKASLEAKTKDELMEMAREREIEIEGRGSMAKDELVEALVEQPPGDDVDRDLSDAEEDREMSALHDKTVDELQDMARDLDIDGRSSMKKDDLIGAILQEKTVDELQQMARESDIEGRSSMNKDDLIKALR